MVEVERFANGRNFHITKADVTDRNGAIEMILLNLNNLPCVKNIHGSTVEVIKKSDLHKFQVIPKRWIVERTFAWLEKCRRLWKNCERELSTSKQMTVLVLLTLILRRF